jgi:small subunit ribosomal protein S17e
MDRIRSISEQILNRYPQAFSEDFENNKKVLDGIAVISSKQMRNHIAGYIARTLKEDVETEEIVEEVKAE